MARCDEIRRQRRGKKSGVERNAGAERKAAQKEKPARNMMSGRGRIYFCVIREQTYETNRSKRVGIGDTWETKKQKRA